MTWTQADLKSGLYDQSWMHQQGSSYFAKTPWITGSLSPSSLFAKQYTSAFAPLLGKPKDQDSGSQQQSTDQSSGVTPPSSDTYDAKQAADILHYQFRTMLPDTLDAMDIVNRKQLEYNQAAMEQSYPYIDRAAAASTARALAASKDYASFKETLPSTKQALMVAASDAESRRAQAMAMQQDAANNFAHRYVGQMIQVA